MISLPNSDAPRIQPLFHGEHLSLVIKAIIAGHSPARIWVDDQSAPGTALIWDRAHCVYAASPADNSEQWQDAFLRHIAPTAPGLIKLYADEKTLAGHITLPGRTVQPRQRVFYRTGRLAKTDKPEPLPAGFTISEIAAGFDELGALGNFDEIEAEIGSTWTSIADFRRAGFGYCVHDGRTIACWCTAEYVSDGQCGIGIETAPAFRRRGFATAATVAFITHCSAHQITPHWDAWADNTPSIAVAEKTGFRKVDSYSILVVRPDI
jgi:GNAT superfamily N-acetyltransferase